MTCKDRWERRREKEKKGNGIENRCASGRREEEGEKTCQVKRRNEEDG